MLKKILRAFILLLLFSAAGWAQQGPPITVGPTPVPVYAPFNGTTVTLVQISGTSTAYVIYTPTQTFLVNKAAASTYTFTPQPAIRFQQGQTIGFISIPSGTATFRTTAVGGAGVTSISVSGPITSTGGTNPTLACPTCVTTGTRTWQECNSRGLGDGLNAMAAATYLQFVCVNDTGSIVTLTGFRCWTDNVGTSTLNAANNAGTALLTGAVTCNATKASGGAAGTQSGTVTLANGDAISFTFVADGTSKQTNWTVSGTY